MLPREAEGCWGTPGAGRRPGHLASLHPAEALESRTDRTAEVQADGPRRGLRVREGGPGPGGGVVGHKGKLPGIPLAHTQGKDYSTPDV